MHVVFEIIVHLHLLKTSLFHQIHVNNVQNQRNVVHFSRIRIVPKSNRSETRITMACFLVRQQSIITKVQHNLYHHLHVVHDQDRNLENKIYLDRFQDDVHVIQRFKLHQTNNHHRRHRQQQQ